MGQMTNEQCIEIAEKVWGWKWYPDNADAFPGMIDRLKENVAEQVNSWQGFGRTVEAMAENFYELQPNIDRNGYASGAIGFSRYDYIYHDLNCQYDMDKPEKIIEATHLAALAALKE